MTASSDGPIENPLYALLPAIFRQQDIAQGYPLLALMKVFDHVRTELGTGISALEQDWFIETCPLEYVPLIGGLLGLEIARPVRPEHRALVANTLAFRRRKGIAAALPKLARDSAGWFSLYSPGASTPWAAWPLPDAAAQPDATSMGLLRIWRLPVFAVIGATPAPAGISSYYHFNPLGMDQPLFNLPSTPIDWVAAPPVTALPVRLTTAMLAADLMRYNMMWPHPAGGPASSLLYGPARGLVIRTKNGSGDWTELQPGSLRAMSLVDCPPVPPDYPVLEGETIDLASVTAAIAGLTIKFGDATAAVSVNVPATPTMPDLVALLQGAIASATITPGRRVAEAAVKALKVGAIGNALVIVPGMCPSEPLSIGPTNPGGLDPLLLTGSARMGIAAATLPLTPQLIALLTDTPADTVMTFTAPGGQVLQVPLPLMLQSRTVAAVVQAFATALTACFVCDGGDQVVIVPPRTAPQQPVPATPPAPALGLVPAVAIDPELGLFSWPTAWTKPDTLSVDYGIAMPGAIGGLGLRPPPPVPAAAVVLKDDRDPAWLEQQLGTWAQSKAACTLLTLQTSATRPIAAQQLAPASGQALWVVGAAGSQPFVVTGSPGTLTLLGPPSPVKSGAIAMSGVTLESMIGLLGGDIELTLLDTTLYPGAAPLAISAVPPQPPQPSALPGTATLKLERCLLGPIDLSLVTGHIEIDSSVLSKLPVPEAAFNVLTLPAEVTAKFDRLTVIGGGKIAGTLHAANSLFDGVLACSGDAHFIDCYVTDLQHPSAATGDVVGAASRLAAAVSRCNGCGKARRVRLSNCLLRRVTLLSDDRLCACEEPTDAPARDCATCVDSSCAKTCPLRASGQSWEPVGQPPRFVEPNAYPLPDFARLSEENPPVILAGASNRDVLGAYNLAAPTARLNQFEAAIQSGLLFGTRLDQRYES
ncbi:hypothetical protein ACMGDH_11260 [Sphingomonas sp. DT-207]|uniref:hypothetical protein n=1 Tax=Sphingomonas sp. DT-207 TaxID=3396167 RepID=UPI003F1CA6CF